MGMHGGGHGGWGHRHELRDLARHEVWDGKLIRRALASFHPYRLRALIVMLAILMVSGLQVLPPLLTRELINRGILGHEFRLILITAATMVAIAIAAGLLNVWQGWMSNWIAQQVMADFRRDLFAHLHSQSLEFFTDARAGELTSRVINDVAAIQTVVTGTLTGLVSNISSVGLTLVVMFALNWRLTLLSLVVVPAFIAPTQRVGLLRQNMQRQVQERLARLSSQLVETLGVSGALLVRAFTREDFELRRFTRVNDELKDLSVRQNLAGRWLFMWLGLFSAMGPAMLWGYGGWLVLQHRLSVGGIVAFVALLSQLYSPLRQLAQVHVDVLTSIALFRRIFGLLDHTPDILPGPRALPPPVRGEVRWDHVSFAYPRMLRQDVETHWALSEINLTLPAGSLMALVGPSGAGKTTMMHLVPRFIDPTRGRILLDGHDIRELTFSSLRTQIGLVPQEAFLFHDTVRQNLLYANPEASHEMIEAALEAAQLADIVAKMPDGLETVVGERGHRLSGGEKQRMAIARVFLKSPPLILLDEATSSLDTLSERRIQVALDTLLQGRTALVIAHRLSTILAADRIVVMDQGTVQAIGPHAELLEQGGLYAKLYWEQFAGQSERTLTPLKAHPGWD